jgi:hypothetical protein
MRTRARLDEGRCARAVIPAAAEREERERVCVCVLCERGCGARRSDAVRVGPAWLQRHGCKFVTGVKLEARGGGRAKAKRGGKTTVFRCLAKAGRGGIYTGQVRVRYSEWNGESQKGMSRRVVPNKASRATCMTFIEGRAGGRLQGVGIGA